MSVALVRIQLRSDLATNWKSINPLLSAGEPGSESDTGRMKVGDGVRRWNALPYVGGDGGGGVSGSVDGGIYDGLENLAGAGPVGALSATQQGTFILLSWLPATPYDNDVYVTAYFVQAEVVESGSVLGLGATNQPGEPVPLETTVGGIHLVDGAQYRFYVFALLSDGSMGEKSATSIIQYVEPVDPPLQVLISSEPADLEVGSEGEQIVLTGLAAGGSGIYQYAWEVDGVEVPATSPSITLTGSDYGIGSYPVKVTVLSGGQEVIAQDTLQVVDTGEPPPPAQTLPLYNWGAPTAGTLTPGLGENVWWMDAWEDSYENGFPPSGVVPGVVYPPNVVYGAEAPNADVWGRMGDWVLESESPSSPSRWFQRYENNGNIVFVDSGQAEAYGSMYLSAGSDPNRQYCYARQFHTRREYVDFGDGPIEYGMLVSKGLYTRSLDGSTSAFAGPFAYYYKPTTGSLGPLTAIPLAQDEHPMSVHFTYDRSRPIPPDYNGSPVYSAVSFVLNQGKITYTTNGTTWNTSDDFRDIVPGQLDGLTQVWFDLSASGAIGVNSASPRRHSAQRT